MRINLALKIAVIKSGQPQRHVAALCGIAENRFSEIVRGWEQPRPRERDAIANALGMKVEELFGGVEPISA